MAKKKDSDTGIPKHEIESLARLLLPEMQRYFESDIGKLEFEEWKANQVKAEKEVD